MKRTGETQRPPVFGSVFGLGLISVTALLMLVPVPDGPVKSLFVPQLVLVPVYFLTLRPKQGVGPVGAFLAGLSVDIVTFGPLGVMASVVLFIHLLLCLERDALMVFPAGFRVAGFALAAGFGLACASLSMAFLGSDGFPSFREFSLVLAGLLVVGAGFEFALTRIGGRRLKSGFGGRMREPARRRMKKRRQGPGARKRNSAAGLILRQR